MGDELKPCPWCGGIGEVWEDRATWGDRKFGETITVVFCDSCGNEVVGCCFTVESAIDAWNALPRTVPAAPSDRERRLEEALEAVSGGCFSGASNVVLSGDWQGFSLRLQQIARAALADTNNNGYES